MRRPFAALAALLVLAACADGANPAGAPEGAAPLLSAAANGVPGEYIVVLKEGASPTAVAAAAGAQPRHVYDAALNGFAGPLNSGQLNALRRHPAVAYVEQDQVVTTQSVPWGLDRIDQMFLPLDGHYNYNTLASTVHAYIIDTGIRVTHPEFEGRAVNVYDPLGGNGDDCNGHGTGVAGIVGARTYGVAKRVRLYGVRVLNCSGAGTISGIINGINWVAANHLKPAVANLSLGGSASLSLNNAVTSLFNANVFVAVAAGNSNADACSFSPSGATSATTVASSDINDHRVTSSNFGPCVDLYAPGRNIPTVGLTSTPILMSGTSAASPHVAGIGALYLGHFPASSSATVRNWVITVATPGVIINNPPNTPNRLAFKSTL